MQNLGKNLFGKLRKMIEAENKLAISWLKNGIWALALAGLYSIVLVI